MLRKFDFSMSSTASGAITKQRSNRNIHAVVESGRPGPAMRDEVLYTISDDAIVLQSPTPVS
jgi:hypothetical protein